MGLTLIGVVLGAIVSWGITHAYYRISEKKATQESPVALLTQVSSDIDALRESLGHRTTPDASLAASLADTLKQIDHIKYVFRAALQNWFSEFTALKVLLREDKRPAVVAQISQMDDMMKTMAADLKNQDTSEAGGCDDRSHGG